MKFLLELDGEYNGEIVEGVEVRYCFELVHPSKTIIVIEAVNEEALYNFKKELKSDILSMSPVKQVSDRELEEKIAAYKEIQEHPVRVS